MPLSLTPSPSQLGARCDADVVSSCVQVCHPADMTADSPSSIAPDTFIVTFHVRSPSTTASNSDTAGGTSFSFQIHVTKEDAPYAAQRFYNLARASCSENGDDGKEKGEGSVYSNSFSFFGGQRFYRVVPGWVVQFGVSGTPAVSAIYQHTNDVPGAIIPADPVRKTNGMGTVAFSAAYSAEGMACNQTSELFINLADNAKELDARGFAPFGSISRDDMELITAAGMYQPN